MYVTQTRLYVKSVTHSLSVFKFLVIVHESISTINYRFGVTDYVSCNAYNTIPV